MQDGYFNTTTVRYLESNMTLLPGTFRYFQFHLLMRTISMLLVSLVLIKGWIFTSAIAESLFWSCQCLQAQAIQYQVPFGENGNFLLLVLVALKTGQEDMSTSIKHIMRMENTMPGTIKSYIIHCWCRYNGCLSPFCALELYHNLRKCYIIAQIICHCIIRNPERAIKKCWNMA